MMTIKEAMLLTLDNANTAAVLRCMDTAAIAGGMTENEEVIAFSILCAAYEEKLIGSSDAAVLACAEPAAENLDTWQADRQKVLDFLKTADLNSKIVVLANRLASLRKIHRGFLVEGNGVWAASVQKDYMMQAWYYKGIEELMEDLSKTAAYKEFDLLIDEIFESQFDL